MSCRLRTLSLLAAVSAASALTLVSLPAAADEPEPRAEPPAEPKVEPRPETHTEPRPDTHTEPPADSGRPAGAEVTVPADGAPLAPFPPAEPEASPVKITPMGYVEAYYAWNFNRPANNISNYRFDNRHNSFTLNNAALGAAWEVGPVSGRLILQIGSTPSTYYAAEPVHPGASGANASGPELWKYLQEANVSYKAPIGNGLKLTAGLMPTPIGMEQFAVKDNWTWSRSNVFFGLPYYHAGLRATYALTDRLDATVSVLNGWNSIVDNNDGKSLEGHVTYRVPNKAVVQVLYFGGVERSPGAPEGQRWRNLFDLTGEVNITSWLQAAAQLDYGFEPNRIGTASWVDGAIAGRAKACKWLYLVVRGDRFYEHLATDASGRKSTPLFWNGVEWVSSFTATVDVRPHSNLSIRAEFRHDQADGLLYFTGDTLVGDGSLTNPYLPNARRQQTLLLGATAWF